MMKLYLAIVASLLTPAHGAAVDVLDTPKNRRALRSDLEKGACKACLNNPAMGTVERCKMLGNFYANCEASDKDFEWDPPDCGTCENDFKSKGGCPIITEATCTKKELYPGYSYWDCGTAWTEFSAKINEIGVECWTCIGTPNEMYDSCTKSDPAPSSSPSPSPAPSSSPSPSPSPSPSGGGGGGGGDDPCFSRDTYACRLLDPKARYLGGESD